MPFICRSQGTLQAFINSPSTPLREVNIIILFFTDEAIEAVKGFASGTPCWRSWAPSAGWTESKALGSLLICLQI